VKHWPEFFFSPCWEAVPLNKKPTAATTVLARLASPGLCFSARGHQPAEPAVSPRFQNCRTGQSKADFTNGHNGSGQHHEFFFESPISVIHPFIPPLEETLADGPLEGQAETPGVASAPAGIHPPFVNKPVCFVDSAFFARWLPGWFYWFDPTRQPSRGSVFFKFHIRGRSVRFSVLFFFPFPPVRPVNLMAGIAEVLLAGRFLHGPQSPESSPPWDWTKTSKRCTKQVWDEFRREPQKPAC